MVFETKMRYAKEHRERGNTLFKNGYFQSANDEYEQGMRYLLFNPHPTEEEVRPTWE
jgi:NADH:ubiquinone oxidoreductase subunit